MSNLYVHLRDRKLRIIQSGGKWRRTRRGTTRKIMLRRNDAAHIWVLNSRTCGVTRLRGAETRRGGVFRQRSSSRDWRRRKWGATQNGRMDGIENYAHEDDVRLLQPELAWRLLRVRRLQFRPSFWVFSYLYCTEHTRCMRLSSPGSHATYKSTGIIRDISPRINATHTTSGKIPFGNTRVQKLALKHWTRMNSKLGIF